MRCTDRLASAKRVVVRVGQDDVQLDGEDLSVAASTIEGLVAGGAVDDRLRSEVAMLQEELRIKDARLSAAARICARDTPNR